MILSVPVKWRPLAWIGCYWIALAILGGLNLDTMGLGTAILLLSYTGRKPRAFLDAILPMLVTVMIYDSMRYYADWIRHPYIRVREPYDFDKVFFGITTPSGVLTPNEWWQLHTHWSLDLLTGFFYLAFVAIFMGMGVYYRFWQGPEGARSSARMMWAFFWTNMLGYSTYYWYPAAPPWYVTLKGLGPADLTTLPNPAGCLRFDELLGTHFFTGMYGKSADVFGAIPSLHVAYPLLAMLHAFELKSLRIFGTFFYLVMCFSAVYLNHHYILDVLWGSAYAGLMYGLVRLHNNYRSKTQPELP
jgi:inositol phosphorylceramide synthase catalytic subunit